MQYRRPACAAHAERSLAKGATFFFAVITCKRKSILCHKAHVALIKEVFRHVIKQHTLRIRAFVLLPDHTCLRAARRQVHGVWICDVKVGHGRLLYRFPFYLCLSVRPSPRQAGNTMGLYNGQGKHNPPNPPFLMGT